MVLALLHDADCVAGRILDIFDVSVQAVEERLKEPGAYEKWSQSIEKEQSDLFREQFDVIDQFKLRWKDLEKQAQMNNNPEIKKAARLQCESLEDMLKRMQEGMEGLE